MKKRVLNILVIIILSQTIISAKSNQASHLSQDLSISLDAETTINSFENFVIGEDSANIDSSVTPSNITMMGSYKSPLEHQYELHHLYLDSIGNIGNFEVSVDIDYQFFGTMLTAFKIAVGSYYTETGEYIGKPTEAYTNNICQSYILDAWDTRNGQFEVYCAPYNIGERQHSSYGILPTSGVFTLRITRNDNVVTGLILQNETIMFSHSWSSSVNRPMNYIGIYGEIDTLYTSNTLGVFSNFSATLEISSTLPPTSTPTPTLTTTNPNGNSNWAWIGITIGVVSATIITISVILARKRTSKRKVTLPENEIETVQLESARYSWDLED